MGVFLFRPVSIGIFAIVFGLAVSATGSLAQSSGEGQSGGNGKEKPAAKKPGSGGRGDDRPLVVRVDEVTRGELVEAVPIYGRVIATQAGVVAARVRGAVAEIRADVGARVAKGDILVVLLTDMLRSERELKIAELAEYRAKIKTAQAQLRLSEQEFERIERLRKSAAYSAARYEDKRREVERYRSTVAETTARMQQAEVERDMAEINLANATIRAPYDGVVTKRHTETGAFLNVSDKVVTMTNDSSL